MTTLARFSWTLCVLHVVALGGCPSRQQDAGAPGAGRPSGSTRTEPCDPFEAHELPTELETIFAAGKDMTGTIYVVDRPSSGGSDDRVFVSRGDTFFRKRVVGAGSSGDSDFTWQFEHDGKTVRLVVRKQGTKIIGIALAPADQKTFFDQLDETAQQLTPVDPASIANFSVRNLTGEVVVEFVADTEAGARIVVMRPNDDWTYEDFRVFYGTNGHLIERVTSFAGARSYRAFDFIVDGASWHVVFASSLAPSIESTLDTGAASNPLTLVEPPAPSPNDTFECFVRK